jgi:hypothetical protein
LVITPKEIIAPQRIPLNTEALLEEQVILVSYEIRSRAARVVQAKKMSVPYPVASACTVDPGGNGPSEAKTQTLAKTRKTGLTPIRNNKYRHTAAKREAVAAREMKQLAAESQDRIEPQGSPNIVIAGGRMLTIEATIPCRSPDQKARLTAMALCRYSESSHLNRYG